MRYSHSKYCPDCGERVEIWEYFKDGHTTYKAVALIRGLSNVIVNCKCGRDLNAENWHTSLLTESELDEYHKNNNSFSGYCTKCKRSTHHNFFVTDDGNDISCQVCGSIPIYEHDGPF